MSQETLGLVIGGVLPAIAFGLSGVFSKASTQAGIGLGPYLMTVGAAVFVCGLCLLTVTPDRTITLRAATPAFLTGFLWALGAAGVAMALSRYGIPLGKIVPLYNTNTLVAVLVGLWVFAEWKQVQPLRLLAGSLLIVAGSVLVAKA